MAVRSYSNEDIEKVRLDSASKGREEKPARRCAYCVPAGDDERAAESHLDECLIKMLGTVERKQVALTLYRAGHGVGLFTKACPMSTDRAYEDCPFYEDESALPDE